MEKLPDTRTYEIYGGSHANRTTAFKDLLRDITAANDLGIPFTVKTVSTKEFRDGGNVTKTSVLSYVVVLGEVTKGKNDE